MLCCQYLETWLPHHHAYIRKHHWAVHWLVAETSKPVHSFDREYIGHHSNTHFIILKIFASHVMKLILYTGKYIYISCLLYFYLFIY